MPKHYTIQQSPWSGDFRQRRDVHFPDPMLTCR